METAINVKYLQKGTDGCLYEVTQPAPQAGGGASSSAASAAAAAAAAAAPRQLLKILPAYKARLEAAMSNAFRSADVHNKYGLYAGAPRLWPITLLLNSEDTTEELAKCAKGEYTPRAAAAFINDLSHTDINRLRLTPAEEGAIKAEQARRTAQGFTVLDLRTTALRVPQGGPTFREMIEELDVYLSVTPRAGLSEQAIAAWQALVRPRALYFVCTSLLNAFQGLLTYHNAGVYHMDVHWDNLVADPAFVPRIDDKAWAAMAAADRTAHDLFGEMALLGTGNGAPPNVFTDLRFIDFSSGMRDAQLRALYSTLTADGLRNGIQRSEVLQLDAASERTMPLAAVLLKFSDEAASAYEMMMELDEGAQQPVRPSVPWAFPVTLKQLDHGIRLVDKMRTHPQMLLQNLSEYDRRCVQAARALAEVEDDFDAQFQKSTYAPRVRMRPEHLASFSNAFDVHYNSPPSEVRAAVARAVDLHGLGVLLAQGVTAVLGDGALRRAQAAAAAGRPMSSEIRLGSAPANFELALQMLLGLTVALLTTSISYAQAEDKLRALLGELDKHTWRS